MENNSFAVIYMYFKNSVTAAGNRNSAEEFCF